MEDPKPAIKPADRGESIMPIHGTFNFHCGPGGYLLHELLPRCHHIPDPL